ICTVCGSPPCPNFC
ncbi:hypothetical protein CIJ63_10210, partial [Neisseria meningitidis]